MSTKHATPLPHAANPMVAAFYSTLSARRIEWLRKYLRGAMGQAINAENQRDRYNDIAAAGHSWAVKKAAQAGAEMEVFESLLWEADDLEGDPARYLEWIKSDIEFLCPKTREEMTAEELALDDARKAERTKNWDEVYASLDKETSAATSKTARNARHHAKQEGPARELRLAKMAVTSAKRRLKAAQDRLNATLADIEAGGVDAAAPLVKLPEVRKAAEDCAAGLKRAEARLAAAEQTSRV